MDSHPEETLTSDDDDNTSDSELPNLPEEIWIKIFNYLPHTDFFTCKSVCKSWNNLLSSRFKITRIVIFLRDINRYLSMDKIKSWKILHPVQIQTIGSDSNDSFILHMTVKDIVNTLKKIGTSSPSSSSTPKIYNRKQIWIYSFNVAIFWKEIDQLFQQQKQFISHFTLVQSDDGCAGPVTAKQLAETLEILSKNLEYLELSIFPRVPHSQSTSNSNSNSTEDPQPHCSSNPPQSTRTNDSNNNNNNNNNKIDVSLLITSAGFPQMTKLRTLHFSKPLTWLNLPQNIFIILELFRISPNLTHIYNVPLIMNGDDEAKEGKGHINDISFLKSLHFNPSSLHRFRDWNGHLNGKKEIVEKLDAELEAFSSADCLLTSLKIDPWYKSPKSNKCFREFLQSSRNTLEVLKIPPLPLYFNPVTMPKLEKCKKLIFYDPDFVCRRFFMAGGTMDPKNIFPNLNTVELKLDIPVTRLLDDYFPLDIFDNSNKKNFASVSLLKISCKLGDPETSARKLSLIFPNVKQLDLKPCKNGDGKEFEILSVVHELWPSLTHLTIKVFKFGQLTEIPETFVHDCLLKLKDLKCFKIRFSSCAYGDTKNRALWLFPLGETLNDRNNLQFRTNVCVSCGWKMSRMFVEGVREYFKPWKTLFTFDF